MAVAIAGDGRDRKRLERLAADGPGNVRLLGRVTDAERAEYYGAADLFAMLCRDRWGGLEQEGFGIVFLEAAACGVPQVAGQSGGAAEAVDDGISGLVVQQPDDPREVAAAFERLLDNPEGSRAMGVAGRERAVREFSYDVLAHRLGVSLGALAD